MTAINQLDTAAEQEAVAKPTVFSGQGYPADRVETSQESTGWQASGPKSAAPGALGKLEKVSRGTSE